MAESIVVGTDGSETARRAVDEAIRLAKALGGQLHIVSAFEPVRGARIAGAPEAAAKVWAPLPDSEVQRILEEAAAAARALGAKVKTHAVDHGAADALLEVSAEVGASMIVVGSRGMHGAKRRVLGSVPNTVSHQARCNVLIVSTDRPKGAGRRRKASG
jgi:nucleotide-binding universal stress UspA family protein